MAKDEERTVIGDVPRPAFGPQSDLFSAALSIVLPYYGDSKLTYPEILCRSGRGFKVCWNNEMFFWDRFGDEPHPDPEFYLRRDYGTMKSGGATAGYQTEIVSNRDCLRSEDGEGIDRNANAAEVRDLVRAALQKGRPVISFMNISSEFWAPECCLITGFDNAGDTILGWSPFQEEEAQKGSLELGPEGYFRREEWEAALAVLVVLEDAADGEPDQAIAERESLELGVELSAGMVAGNLAWGLESYEAWATAMEDESDVADLDDELLKGRMLYYRHFVGHLAAQKWYTSSYLRGMQERVWSVSDISHAAGIYARIHEAMWDCWKIVGGYWRETSEEIPKFRDGENRKKIAELAREMKWLDEAASNHFTSALEKWDQTYESYTGS